ncbi:MAG: SIR2 family protein [Gammaproteobacteria bacterium]|nr:SIR2 family protein [Gammaproteobacteria bacterium]
MSATIEALASQIRARRAILFVGAGVSAGFGLPPWRALVGHLGRDLGYDPDEFRDFSDSLLTLAEYYRLRKGSLAAVCEWISEEWNVSDDALRESRLHDILVDLDFPLIYTTNFDQLLERAYEVRGRPINKVVTVGDLSEIDLSLPTVIKFHGDIDDESSLMLSETDYFRRLGFEAPLDIKLRADALGRTVLFIGYSLTDINIRLMLYRMKGMWLETGQELPQPCSYIFTPRANPIQQAVLESWGLTPIVGEGFDESASLLSFLERLQQAVAAGTQRDRT